MFAISVPLSVVCISTLHTTENETETEMRPSPIQTALALVLLWLVLVASLSWQTWFASTSCGPPHMAPSDLREAESEHVCGRAPVSWPASLLNRDRRPSKALPLQATGITVSREPYGCWNPQLVYPWSGGKATRGRKMRVRSRGHEAARAAESTGIRCRPPSPAGKAFAGRLLQGQLA